MISTIGKNLKVSVWGGSHEPSIGADIEGIPKGTEIDMRRLEAFMKRRAPGSSPFATKRKEPDIPIPVKGLVPAGAAGGQVNSGGQAGPAKAGESDRQPGSNASSVSGGQAESAATGTSDTVRSANDHSSFEDTMIADGDVISLEIKNTDQRSSDYKALRSVPRPGHADYTARLRYGDGLNMAGGGPFSARMTAPLCAAGGIALQMLERKGVTIGAHIYSIAGISDLPFDPVNIDAGLLNELKKKDMPVISRDSAEQMAHEITAAMNDRDSVGGIIEVCATGLPGGIGGAMYDGLESFLAPIFFGIPAVKGVEFGAGFDAAKLRGSRNNDAFYYDGDTVRTRTNNHGGILGGITTGMPLIARLAFKPTPSIAMAQDSVDLEKKENTILSVKGRHDPCVVVRAVPIAEAALALGIMDCIMEVENDR